MAQFGAITSGYSGRAFLARLRGQLEPEDAARMISSLARDCVQSLGFEVDVVGVPPREGALIVANHRSYADAPLIAAHVPMLFLVKAEVARWPIVGSCARALHTVFVQREDPLSRVAARDGLRAMLARGLSVGVFPEGTTTAGPGLLPFRPGAFQIAANLGLTVVPVAVSYPDRAMAYWKDDVFVPHFLTRFQHKRIQARVAFGPALHESDAGVLREKTSDWIAGALATVESPAAPPQELAA
jgi:1-acyl-sn-glycerol-3-phosphate acyltransferase